MINTKLLKEEIKYLATKEGLKYGELIDLMNQKYGEKYSMNNMTNKFTKGTIRVTEIAMLLDVIGYDITFIKREKDPKEK